MKILWFDSLDGMTHMNTSTATAALATWPLRVACESDVAALEALICLSVHGLQATFYSQAQRDAALGSVFGVDRQLIRDGTYFVAEQAGQVVGCGGWSRRRSLYGGDGDRTSEDALLDPQHDAARVRAFFVHPGWARRGIGRTLMVACEQAITAAGFRAVEIVATLPGEPLYASFGYAVVERYEIPMADSLRLPVVRMSKRTEQRTTKSEVSLRDVRESDLPIFFAHQLEPEATRMAAFPSREHDAFMAHWAKCLAGKTATVQTITSHENVAGNIVCWEQGGDHNVGFWLGKEYWNRGIASAALSQFLTRVSARPLHAHVAKHNSGSLRVLQKCGFTICGEGKFSDFNGEETEEFILTLGAPDGLNARGNPIELREPK
jgi:RimJ/RimL family protein N-acetyltransferase